MSGDVAIEAPGTTGSPSDPARPTPQEPAAEQAPLIKVVRGRPGPQEIAALTLVLAAAAGGGGEPAPSQRTLWTNRSRYARPRPAVGPGGWRASALPR